jgi:hypothetical protein
MWTDTSHNLGKNRVAKMSASRHVQNYFAVLGKCNQDREPCTSNKCISSSIQGPRSRAWYSGHPSAIPSNRSWSWRSISRSCRILPSLVHVVITIMITKTRNRKLPYNYKSSFYPCLIASPIWWCSNKSSSGSFGWATHTH